ncbi:hypothetical protein [Absidia glauca]|uniref:C2H2-type domain-containing protein n=1 Tax=Absidia glauca TaxID=4829 RepID=A0A168S162_ABSGL|nr:hypothetical protein [Absidia glauca]
MLSVYSGMDTNFTQSFPTPFGLARSRVGSFELQEVFRHQHQHQLSLPSHSNMATASVSLVEPMMQSTLTMMPPSTLTTTPTPSLSSTSSSSSHSSSNPQIYYDGYTPPYAPLSASASPLLNDSWAYATPTDLFSESTYQSFSSQPLVQQHDQEKQFVYSPTDPSLYDQPTRKECHQPYSDCTIATLSPVSTSHVYDPVPSLLYTSAYSSSSYHYNDRSTLQSGNEPLSQPLPIHSPTTSFSSSSSSSSSSSQLSNKRKRDPSPLPMMNKKAHRSPPSGNNSSEAIYQQPYHHHPSSKQHEHSRCPPSSSPYPTMNMISSFPTRVNLSTSKSPKRYVCHICSKKFTRPSSLTTHIYSHTGEKPFKCPMDGCGRHFSVVSNLRRHAKIHTLPLPKY